MKCPNCGWKPEDDFEPTTADGIGDFTSFMDSVIKRVSDKQKKEYGYGIQEKSNQKRSKATRK